MANALAEFFSSLEQAIDRSKTAGMTATFQFVATGEGGGEWHIRLTDGVPTVAQGLAENPNITLSASAPDLLDIISGKLSGQTAFLTGRLKIQGDVTLAMKLQTILG